MLDIHILPTLAKEKLRNKNTVRTPSRSVIEPRSNRTRGANMAKLING